MGVAFVNSGPAIHPEPRILCSTSRVSGSGAARCLVRNRSRRPAEYLFVDDSSRDLIDTGPRSRSGRRRSTATAPAPAEALPGFQVGLHQPGPGRLHAEGGCVVTARAVMVPRSWAAGWSSSRSARRRPSPPRPAPRASSAGSSLRQAQGRDPRDALGPDRRSELIPEPAKGDRGTFIILAGTALAQTGRRATPRPSHPAMTAAAAPARSAPAAVLGRSSPLTGATRPEA